MPRLPDDMPRKHYYVFAHRLLPNMLLRKPAAASTDDARPLFRDAALTGPVAGGLQRMWESLANSYGAPADATLPINSSAHDCAGRTVILITPPPPEHTTEAHFIAVVLDRDDPDFVRYVVLEFGREIAGAPRTVLCRWTATEHINCGDGPEPTAEAFLRVVCEKFTE